MLESKFQGKLIKKIKERFPGCIVLKNDPNYIQGFPDLTILYKDKWVVLESKRAQDSEHQPNQDYYVEKLDEMSYSRFINPDNLEVVMNEMESTFGP